jgi:hypothetical protein
MARIRTIKPEFWTDSFMVQLDPLARLIYIALWTAADDHGYIPYESDRLAMELMPREDPTYVAVVIDMLWAADRLELHEAEDGSRFYRVAKWTSHQRVDHPGKSKLYREGSRKLAIPNASRRAVAEKYGCPPGESIAVNCYYCGAEGEIYWVRLYSGRPSSWVVFPDLELDHFVSEVDNGTSDGGNLVLACRSCNRKKGAADGVEFLITRAVSRGLARPPEVSRPEQGREQGAWNRDNDESQHNAQANGTPEPSSSDLEDVLRVVARANLSRAKSRGTKIEDDDGWLFGTRRNLRAKSGAAIAELLATGRTVPDIAAEAIGDPALARWALRAEKLPHVAEVQSA